MIKKIFCIICFSFLFCSNAFAHASSEISRKEDKSKTIYIFVSYSMSDEALKAYYREASVGSASLVMRGLLDNSFIRSKVKSMELGIEYDIDPNLFEKYEIKSVPVIIRIKEEKSGIQIIEKVSGHISLFSALEIFDDKAPTHIR